MSRRSLFAATGAVLAVGLAACTANDPLAKQAVAGDNKGFVAGDGSVTEYAANKRSAPVDFSGTLFKGGTVSAAQLRGKVTVLNFWYAACSPCRLEAPDLQALHVEFEPKGVEFLGVNIRDEAPTAEAFERTFKLTYPSIMDKDGGVLLALSQRDLVKPSAVPTTLVLDKQGRVSARLLGTADKGTLKALIISALAEK
ncbi:TlpA disulfide reductase family protein [Arthrobacter sp. SDTb3-6]|uniref:TlpA family protein disulfide reductase n=1 Tax=Arthrobacter sp. SDTb3-6 TaxID=2713571 RepID=UPI00159DC8C4|nr:TlpA disulfide reductase family protein [Arthrobacter sp. SDTb3-6]NVM99782.1 TlpA family protein disulfide reductase [Arthrobacter sp. SDTb3-6]